MKFCSKFAFLGTCQKRRYSVVDLTPGFESHTVPCAELFHPLGEEEAELVNGPAHPAMFSAVMRKAGVPKQLGRSTCKLLYGSAQICSQRSLHTPCGATCILIRKCKYCNCCFVLHPPHVLKSV